MNEDRIDASLGLTLSLRLFERYRQNGVLQASIQRVPGFRGVCTGYLKLVQGKVVSCEIQTSDGQHYPVTIAFLTRLDQDKGPFEWMLIVTADPTSSSASSTAPTPDQRSFVPRPIAPLNLDQLSSWEPRYRMALHMVYSWVDGQRSVDEIKASISLPPHVIDEIFRILLSLKVIA